LLFYGALLVAIFLQRHPLLLPAPGDPEQGGGSFPEERPHAPALLLLPEGEAERAKRLSDLPLAQVWGNFLVQEYGSLTVRPSRGWSEEDLRAASLLVVPEACAATVESRQDLLDGFARSGGVVVLERPAPEQAARTTGFLGYCDSSLVDRGTLAKLASIPLYLERRPHSNEEGWTVLARAAGNGAPAGGPPLISTRSAGLGGYVSVDFRFARHLLIWQQGLCAEDFSIPLRHRERAGVPFCQTNSLVADSCLLYTDFPHADAYERLLGAAIETVRPQPRLWPFPYAHDGAYVMTHDDENFGDLSTALTGEEARQGYASTLFVVPARITPAGVSSMKADGADIGIHWWRGWTEKAVRPVAILGWRPVERMLSLGEQRDRLRKLGVAPVTSSRIHGLVWAPHYTKDFRRLEAAGITLDSTYGPTGHGMLGYVFGTGLPFHPIDLDGRPFRLIEVPFVYQDDERWMPGLDERLLATSQESTHQLIVPIVHSTTMVTRPSAAHMDAWLAAGKTARDRNHWLVPLSTFAAFWSSRGAPGLTRDAEGFRRTTDADPGDLALMVPEGIRLTPAPIDSVRRSVRLHGRGYMLVPIRSLPERFALIPEVAP
jgi:hypothetical protein